VAWAVGSFGSANPWVLRTAVIPLAVAVAGVVIVGFVARRWHSDLVAGIGAGLLAGWAAFTLRLALHGTPYGFDGLGGDAGRLAAMANQYSTTWHTSDGIVHSVPSAYPPLFPWLVGHTAALVHVPAWRLLGPAEAVTVSLVVIAGFAMWRLLVPAPLALALTLPVLLGFEVPSKSYEILALAVLTPWVIATFGQPPHGRRRLHWLPAGVIGGLSVTLYWQYLLFGLLGIVALVVLTWRDSPGRGRYARHVALTTAVALLVASWYLVPYVGWTLLHGSRQVADVGQAGVASSPLIFLAMTPLAVLELIGLGGLAWYRGRVWWGRPLALLTASAYAYWLIWLVIFSATWQTGILQDTPRLIAPLLASAGVLTIVQSAPVIVRKFDVKAVPAALPTTAVCLLVLWTAVSSWQAWMPGGPGEPGGPPGYQYSVSSTPNDASAAFSTPLPDDTYPQFEPASMRWPIFPVHAIEKDVESVDGQDAAPVTLSASESLFAFADWPGYIALNEGAADPGTNWPARFAVVQQLARTTDPSAFATASAHTRFGPIDVFILQVSPRQWVWPDLGPAPVAFSPAQFSSRAFTVFTNLTGGFVVAVRRPAQHQ